MYPYASAALLSSLFPLSFYYYSTAERKKERKALSFPSFFTHLFTCKVLQRHHVVLLLEIRLHPPHHGHRQPNVTPGAPRGVLKEP